MNLTLHEIARVVNAKNDIAKFNDLTINKIEFDSRLITEGDLFLPLKGARDGHEFIETAFEKGAVAVFSEKEISNTPYIWVDDCLKAFQDLAAYYIDKTEVEVVAVTGSNGKTTTKDMIHDVLATTYKTYKTQGNYNNEIGLPYTVLQMPEGTEKLVLEMGQDHLGDIKLLSELAKPSIGIITLIGEAHLEFFGSRDKIAQGKMQMADGMSAKAKLIVPKDPIIDPFKPNHLILHEFGAKAELMVTDLVERKTSLTFKPNFMSKTITLPVPGKYNATNALIAAYVGRELGVSEDNIIEALANLKLTRNRTEWKKANNGADILSDVYNANPTAMKLILETFSAIPANENGKKIAVLADMKELGEQSVDLHNQMILSLSPESLDTVICYGEDIANLAQLASQIFPIGQVYYFKKNTEEDQFEHMLTKVKELLQPNDQILLKGSNSMNLSKLVEMLEK